MNNIDIILLQWHLSRSGIYEAASEQSVLEVDVLDAEEMGRSKDLSNFDKGQIIMARRLGQSISETTRLVECSLTAVVSTYRQWSEEGQTTNRRQGVGRPRLIDARGQQRLSRLV